ncbi:MAG: aconitase family protein [Saprospiraceae bacterium]
MKTLYDKLWDDHVVEDLGSGDHLVYIDRHFLHEVTSPQAFDGISKKNLKPWRLAANIATPDHNVPTARGQNFELESIEDEVSKIQIIELVLIRIIVRATTLGLINSLIQREGLSLGGVDSP